MKPFQVFPRNDNFAKNLVLARNPGMANDRVAQPAITNIIPHKSRAKHRLFVVSAQVVLSAPPAGRSPLDISAVVIGEGRPERDHVITGTARADGKAIQASKNPCIDHLLGFGR